MNAFTRTHCSHLFSAVWLGFLDLVPFLLSCGADVNLGWRDVTPLMESVSGWHSSQQTVHLLLASGADVTKKDSKGRTALHYLAMFGSVSFVEIVSALVRFGANVNAQDEDGVTPLMHAANRKTELSPLFEVLIDLGANVGLRDKLHRTARDHYILAWDPWTSPDTLHLLESP